MEGMSAGPLQADEHLACTRAPHLTERVVDGDLVIYDPSCQRVHALNPTAALIWSLCDCTQSQAGIVDLLCQRYQVEREAIERDVATTLEIFASEGLLSQ